MSSEEMIASGHAFTRGRVKDGGCCSPPAVLVLSSVMTDHLPEPNVTIEGDTKTVVSYDVQDEKIRKVTN